MDFTVLVTCEISTEILPYNTKLLIEDLLKFPVCKYITADSEVTERIQRMRRG